MPKTYTLIGADGKTYQSDEPGTLGGFRSSKIYGRLDCSIALGNIRKYGDKNRVYFRDEKTALSAGYRPCAHCMKEQYHLWKDGLLKAPE